MPNTGIKPIYKISLSGSTLLVTNMRDDSEFTLDYFLFRKHFTGFTEDEYELALRLLHERYEIGLDMENHEVLRSKSVRVKPDVEDLIMTMGAEGGVDAEASYADFANEITSVFEDIKERVDIRDAKDGDE